MPFSPTIGYFQRKYALRDLGRAAYAPRFRETPDVVGEKVAEAANVGYLVPGCESGA